MNFIKGRLTILISLLSTDQSDSLLNFFLLYFFVRGLDILLPCYKDCSCLTLVNFSFKRLSLDFFYRGVVIPFVFKKVLESRNFVWLCCSTGFIWATIKKQDLLIGLCFTHPFRFFSLPYFKNEEKLCLFFTLFDCFQEVSNFVLVDCVC